MSVLPLFRSLHVNRLRPRTRSLKGLLLRALGARDESPAAFAGRCIPPGGVAPPSHIPDILGRRALPGGRLVRLGAARPFHHGLLGVGALVFVLPSSSTGQALGMLRVRIVLADTDGAPTPAPRYALLVSDNPPTAAPRRIITTLDGTVEVKLRPGNYTIESDKPLAFRGRRYQWMQMVDIAAGRDTVLDLTAANAEVTDLGPSDAAPGAAPESDTGFLLQQWRAQRRRHLDGEHARVRIPRRRQRARRHESARHRRGHVGGGAAHARKEGGGARPRRGRRARRRHPLARSSGRRGRPPGAARVHVRGQAARGRRRDLHRRRAAPRREGHDLRPRERRHAEGDRDRFHPAVGQRWRTGLLGGRRRRGPDVVRRRTRGRQPA